MAIAVSDATSFDDETVFEVPALVAGSPQLRSFRRVFPNYADPYRTSLKVYNRSGATVIINTDAGHTKRVGQDGFIEIEGVIRWYTVDVTANTAADLIEVFENGGLIAAQSVDEALVEEVI